MVWILKTRIFVTACVILLMAGPAFAQGVMPWQENPQYWSYKGEPVLLLGGSKTDHIFLLDDLREHLDEIQAEGGNYVRCTMSQREGAELKPHFLRPDGRFDLDQWNEEYWQRFVNCLKWCEERGIIMQIELWDRFDYSQEQWRDSSWRPANNVNYTSDETGFADAYPAPAYRDRQPFFHTLPDLPRYNGRYEKIRGYQEAFAAKMLSYSLDYNHVLYCIGNESSAPDEWGIYWAEFIKKKAKDRGVTVYVTQMYDSCRLEPVMSRPDVYDFVEGSKIIGPRQRDWAFKGEGQWTKILEVQAAMKDQPRPINVDKIICVIDEELDYYSQRKFWRGLFVGLAAIRFHRPPAGAGLDDMAKASLRAARLLESRMKVWKLEPQLVLLGERDEDEAYLRAEMGEKYAIYFPDGGEVQLDLRDAPGSFDGRWIDLDAGEWGESFALDGGGLVSIATPNNRGWVATLVRRTEAETK